MLFVCVNSLNRATTTFTEKQMQEWEAKELVQGRLGCELLNQVSKAKRGGELPVIGHPCFPSLWYLPSLPFPTLFLPHSPTWPLRCPPAQDSTPVIGRACKIHKVATLLYRRVMANPQEWGQKRKWVWTRKMFAIAINLEHLFFYNNFFFWNIPIM